MRNTLERLKHRTVLRQISFLTWNAVTSLPFGLSFWSLAITGLFSRQFITQSLVFWMRSLCFSVPVLEGLEVWKHWWLGYGVWQKFLAEQHFLAINWSVGSLDPHCICWHCGESCDYALKRRARFVCSVVAYRSLNPFFLDWCVYDFLFHLAPLLLPFSRAAWSD